MFDKLLKKLQLKTLEEDSSAPMLEITDELMLKEYAEMIKDEAFVKEHLEEKAPPGWEGSVKAMKKHGDSVKNPWALAWYMKGKGYKPHKKEAVEEKAGSVSVTVDSSVVKQLVDIAKKMEIKIDAGEVARKFAQNIMDRYFSMEYWDQSDIDSILQESVKAKLEGQSLKDMAECEILAQHFDAEVASGKKLSEAETKFLAKHKIEMGKISEGEKTSVKNAMEEFLKVEANLTGKK